MKASPPSPIVGAAGRVAALTLIAAGVGLILGALLADPLGWGGGRGFGWKQLIALIVGLVLLLIGLAWRFQGRLPAPPRGGFDRLDDRR